MGLPTTRNTVYAPGVQIKSVDLNAMQDGIVAHEATIISHTASIASLTPAVSSLQAGKHGTRQLLISAAAAQPEASNTPTLHGSFLEGAAAWYVNPGKPLTFPLPLHVGDRVLQVEVLSDGSGQAGTRTLDLMLNTVGSGAAATVVATASSTATGSGWKTFNFADTVLGSTGIYSIRHSSPVSGNVAGIRVTYDHP